MSTNSHTFSYKLGQILGLALFIIAPIAIIALVIWIWGKVSHFTPESWAISGDIVRNTAGLLALISALLTISVMRRTNKTRAQEAVSSEFHEQLRWVAENLASDEMIKVAYAQMLLNRYVAEKHKLLAKEDHALAVEMQNLASKIFPTEIE